MNMKMEPYHWRHYFGGVAVVLLILQFLTGTFLALFYQPDLQQAYASVQNLYQGFAVGAWIRDGHRWLAFFIFAAMVAHVARSLLRKDFLNYVRRSSWLTGGLLVLPILALLVTGVILPWEWKAYWFMEMVPNYLGCIPLVGPVLKAFLIDAFTLSRNFIAHVVILPVIAYILIDFHILAVLRKRKAGIGKYLAKHAMISIPFFIAVGALAIYIPMPTEDPDVIPMPLEGINIPVPEWFFLFLLRPFLNFNDAIASFLGIYLPLILLVVLIVLPYAFKGRKKKRRDAEPGGRSYLGALSRPIGKLKEIKLVGAVTSFLIVFFVGGAPFGVLYVETHESPTLGCSSCHNVSMGTRMGIPPKAFKDRNIIPLVDDNQWMVEHWFYPQVAW
jgi:quinol-cytochrome oxidoreductase complex cytochrome b subunit